MSVERISALATAGGASSFIGNVLKFNNAPSPFRMMFINPRTYADSKNKIDWETLVRDSVASQAIEWAANLAAMKSPFTESISTVAAEMAQVALNGSDGSMFTFHINPQNLKVNHQKITNEVLTGAGWDFDVLGDQLSNYNFSGTSGNMITTIGKTDFVAIKLSRAYLKFAIFEQFYLFNNNDPLLLIFENTAYLGKLVNLSWNWDANDIYQIKYDFTWRCDPIMSFDVTSGVGVTPMFERGNIVEIMFPANVQRDQYLVRSSSVDSYEDGVKQQNV